MSRRPRGGATACTLTPLAYLAGMGASTFSHKQAVPVGGPLRVGGLSLAKRAAATQEGCRAETYWRRRFIVLVIGLAVFAVAAWALSSTLAVDAGPASASTAASRPRPGLAGQPSWPGASGTGSPSPTPSVTEQATGPGAIMPEFCERGDVVLSIFTDQTAARSPIFDVDVVSTQPAECSFNVGSRHLALVIRQGPVPIWSSADCAAGGGGPVVALKRGVPTVLTISWGGYSSAPGCAGRATRARAGRYTAYALDGALSSAPITFRLR
jgi:hypothetical protein